MTIQFNGDNNLTVHEGFRDKLSSSLTEDLSRFSDHITRMEVHFSDENGSKQGQNDKKCLLEARVEGRQPFVATAVANSYELAVDGAVDKLKSSLDSFFGRLKDH